MGNAANTFQERGPHLVDLGLVEDLHKGGHQVGPVSAELLDVPLPEVIGLLDLDAAPIRALVLLHRHQIHVVERVVI